MGAGEGGLGRIPTLEKRLLSKGLYMLSEEWPGLSAKGSTN